MYNCTIFLFLLDIYCVELVGRGTLHPRRKQPMYDVLLYLHGLHHCCEINVLVYFGILWVCSPSSDKNMWKLNFRNFVFNSQLGKDVERRILPQIEATPLPLAKGYLKYLTTFQLNHFNHQHLHLCRQREGNDM